VAKSGARTGLLALVAILVGIGVGAFAIFSMIPGASVSPAKPVKADSSTARPATTPVIASPSLAVLATGPLSPSDARIASLEPQRSISKLLGSDYSVDVTDMQSGQQIWSRRGTTPLMPASNLKLITAVTAIKNIGAGHRFTTKIVDLGGSKILIVGGGDSTLNLPAVRSMAAKIAPKLKARGGTIQIYVDDTRYPAPTRNVGWRRSYMPYTARPVRALGVQGYMVKDSSGEMVKVLANNLKLAGVDAQWAGRWTSTGKEPLLVANHGFPLWKQIQIMLLESENNIAEMLFRESAIAAGRPATWAGGSATATATMNSLGISTDGIRITDGSGLGRHDFVSAKFFTDLLRIIGDQVRHPEFKAIYKGGLPVSGRSGTLGSDRFVSKNTKCAVGKIRAKTGSLEDAIGLTGYAIGADGREKVFSILVNKRPQDYYIVYARQALDKIAATITGCY